MDGLQLAKKIATILDNKKAEDIKVIRITELSIIADYFVIAGGGSTTQVRSLADEVDFQLGEQFGLNPTRTEGYQTSSWILLDYGTVIVHVFTGEAREFYSLERVWADGQQIELDSE